ncbi:MAG: hypothetical protein GKR86_00485 [Ilumatobacter sp.]|nr:hypothetical protein [Ilumatobacter sp.]
MREGQQQSAVGGRGRAVDHPSGLSDVVEHEFLGQRRHFAYEFGVGFAYVANRMIGHGDDRANRLITALRESLKA